MSVCLSVPSVPSRPLKKVTETETFAKKSCQIYFKGDKNTQSSCSAGRGEAELRIFDFKTTLQNFITSPESVPSSCVRQHTQEIPAAVGTSQFGTKRIFFFISNLKFERKKPRNEVFFLPVQWIGKSNDHFYIVKFSVPNWNGISKKLCVQSSLVWLTWLVKPKLAK